MRCGRIFNSVDRGSADLEVYARATKGRSNAATIEHFLNSEVVVMSYTEAGGIFLLSTE